MWNILELLFKLLVGHAIADFALQSEAMSKGKNRNQISVKSLPKGQKYVPCWPYWLTAHALIHGGMVYLATNILILGIIETAFHWIIDFWKCENQYGPHLDQYFHIFLKIIYVGIISICYLD